MQIRGLLVALGLLAVLAGGIWWSSRAAKDQDSKPDPKAPPKLVSLKEDDVQRITIARQGGETTTVEKDSTGAWKLTSPASFPADRDAVLGLVAAAANVTSDKSVDDKATDLAQFGLSQPAITVTLATKDGKSKQILLGDDAPADSSTYVALAGDAHVYTVATYTKASLDKSAADLRDRRMLTFDDAKLARVVLTAKKSEIEFGKNPQGEWTILQPRPYRTDIWAVDDLVRRLKDVRLDPAIEAEELKKSAAAFNSAAPLATIAVTDAAGTQKLELRKTKDDKVYARSSVVDGVYAVEAAVAKAFDKSLTDFRNKKLFDFGFTDPSRIDYHATATQTVVSKSGEKWFRNGKPLDSNSIQTLLDKLRDLAAKDFEEKGFGSPTIEIAVVSADGKKTERLRLAKAGNDWLAQRDGEPALYLIEAQAVTDIESAAGGLKDDQAKPSAKK